MTFTSNLFAFAFGFVGMWAILTRSVGLGILAFGVFLVAYATVFWGL